MLTIRSLFVFVCCFCLQPVFAIEIKKSSIDDRQYQYHVLENGLKVLLISDALADKAAVSLDVNVGSIHDPSDRQGLAHFLEHMLFLGTKKYPEPDEYQTFISNNGGSHNAYTSRRHTNYFFDIDPDQLEPALDRFSQFFTAPLFDAFYVERERNAVHSEYQASLREDFRRAYDVYRSVINPAHPEAKFNVGSLETLADRPDDLVRDDLIAFYERYYSSEKMALVVLGNQQLDTLKKWVVDRFAQVPQRQKLPSENASAPDQKAASNPLFLPGQLPLEVISRPLKDLRQMNMNFTLPSVAEYYREKPLSYIANLLGHEGEGSLLSLLKQQGLAEGLSAGGRDKGDGSSAFYISIQLTEKGLGQREVVRALVFQTIRLIEQDGIAEWRYQENSRLAHTAFSYRDKSTPINSVKSLAANIHTYAPEDIMSGDYLMEDFNPQLIKDLLSLMTPEKVFVSTVSPYANTDKVSPYYQTPYRTQPISPKPVDLELQWLSQLALPVPNPFVPDNIALFKSQPSLQEISRIDSVANVALWAKQDTRFRTPKAKVSLRIMSPAVSGFLKGYVLNALYVSLLEDQLNEYNYSALLAGSGIGIRYNHHGMDIIITGYQDKLDQLMRFLLMEMNAGTLKRQRFEQIKSDLIRQWRNSNKKTPYHQLYSRLAVNLYQSYWPDDDKINAMESVTLDDVKAFANTWRQGAQIKGLMYGNIDTAWIQTWRPLVEQLQLAQETSVIPPVRVAKLKSQVSQYDVKLVDHNDQAVALYVQGAADTMEDRALMVLIRQIMQSPFYSSLRTEQQLGYIVFMGSLRLRQVPGSVFVVQSPSTDVDGIKRAINLFIEEFAKQLPTDIGIYQQAVTTQLLEKPSGLSASADDYWNNILQGNDQFNNRQLLADAVNDLTAEQLKAYYNNVIANPSRYLWQLSRSPQQLENLKVYQHSEQYYEYFP